MRKFLLMVVCALLMATNISAQTSTQRKTHAVAAQSVERMGKNDSTKWTATYYGYGDAYAYGKRHTANGDVFDPMAMTCASNHHPFGTMLRITNLNNGKSVDVKVTDRGGKQALKTTIDLAYGAFIKIATQRAGRVPISIEVLK